MLAPDTILQNRYVIERLIAEGGMGAVYLARDQRLDSVVALKETLFTDERMSKAFEREARLLASLRHPALPRVSDHFIEENGQFLVMDFIDGDDLGTVLDKNDQAWSGESRIQHFFQLDNVLLWGDQLLDALCYLHAQDPPVIHRDIKPQNLKLTAHGQIILLDFGLAKGRPIRISRALSSGSIFGYTPSYAPIEQIRGTGTDPRSDVYSGAATLYHLMTGVAPVDAFTRVIASAEGQIDPLVDVSELNPQVPQGVSVALREAMALSRHDRPTSSELRSILRNLSQVTTINGNSAVVALKSSSALNESMPRVDNRAADKTPSSEMRSEKDAPVILTSRLGIGRTETNVGVDEGHSISIANNTSRQESESERPIGLIDSVKSEIFVHSALMLNRPRFTTLAIFAILVFCLVVTVFVVWSTRPETLLLTHTLIGHTDKVTAVVFSGDGGMLASGSSDRTVRLWDVKSGVLKRTFVGHANYVMGVALTPDDKTLAVAGADDTISLWDVESGTSLRVLTGHKDGVLAVSFSPDGSSLASGSGDRTIRLWDVQTGGVLRTLKGHSDAVRSVAFSPDGRSLASGSRDGTVKVWDAQTGALRQTLRAHSPHVLSVAFSPDGKTLASAGYDMSVRLWDIQTGAQKQVLSGQSGNVISVAFSPDGSTLASGGSDKTLRLWDTSTGLLKLSLIGHDDMVWSVAISADGTLLASASADATVKLWRLRR